jgi:hypothetical protein
MGQIMNVCPFLHILFLYDLWLHYKRRGVVRSENNIIHFPMLIVNNNKDSICSRNAETNKVHFYLFPSLQCINQISARACTSDYTLTQQSAERDKNQCAQPTNINSDNTKEKRVIYTSFQREKRIHLSKLQRAVRE